MKLDFKNTKLAYQHLSTAELIRAIGLFKAIQSEPLTNIGTFALKGLLKIGVPIEWAIKPTVFKHFVGGEELKQCEKLIDKQYEYGVRTILDYSVEGKKEEAVFDTALEHFKDSVNYLKSNREKIPFLVFKPSALGDSELAKKKQADMEISASEKKLLDRFEQRVSELCQYGSENEVPILVDAEESWIQSYYDSLVEKEQVRLNRSKAMIYNTVQLYRTDRLDYLKNQIQVAREGGYFFGAKLVRGAYMEKEREYAEEIGIESPIHISKANTDLAFDEGLKECIKNIDACAVVIGSHNQDSNYLAAQLIGQHDIDAGDDRVYFSQLLGMADHISYNLAHSQFNVAKYVPYGPVKEVMPYLFRRAEENSSVQGQAPIECQLLNSEIKRRKGHS